MENKKTLILSVLGILVLLGAVIGISVAMYTYAATGTETNLIRTGTITLDVAKAEGNSFTFDGAYPMSDAKGISLTENRAEISVSSTWTGNTPVTIKYDLGIEVVSWGTTLKSSYIKVALVDSTGKVIVGTGSGTNLTGGVTISSLANIPGPNNLISAYGLTGGTISASGTTDRYTIYAWVSDGYNLPVDKTNTTSDNSGTASNNSGTLHKKQTGSETYKFRIKVIGSQDVGIRSVYSWNTYGVRIGDGASSIDDSRTDFETLSYNFFLKHNINDNSTVESQEVCYVLNTNLYCLKNGVENYEENSALLFESFGDEKCDVKSSFVVCNSSNLEARSYNAGSVEVSSGVKKCSVENEGYASCINQAEVT